MAHTPASEKAVGASSPIHNPDIADSLPSLCTLHRRTSEPDGRGGRILTYSPTAGLIRCRIKDVTRVGKRAAGGKVLTTVVATGEFDIEAPITPLSRIVVGDDVWDVLGVDKGVSSPLLLTAELVKR